MTGEHVLVDRAIAVAIDGQAPDAVAEQFEAERRTVLARQVRVELAELGEQVGGILARLRQRLPGWHLYDGAAEAIADRPAVGAAHRMAEGERRHQRRARQRIAGLMAMAVRCRHRRGIGQQHQAQEAVARPRRHEAMVALVRIETSVEHDVVAVVRRRIGVGRTVQHAEAGEAQPRRYAGRKCHDAAGAAIAAIRRRAAPGLQAHAIGPGGIVRRQGAVAAGGVGIMRPRPQRAETVTQRALVVGGRGPQGAGRQPRIIGGAGSAQDDADGGKHAAQRVGALRLSMSDAVPGAREAIGAGLGSQGGSRTRRPAMFRSMSLLLTVACVFATGCSSSRSVKLRGVEPLNVNSANESVTVPVHFYFLAKPQAFQGADYNQLWAAPERVKELLGDDYLGTVETKVVPGPAGAQPVEFDLGEESSKATWIGIMPRFGGNDGQPRTLVVPGDQIGSLVIELTGYHIRDATKR